MTTRVYAGGAPIFETILDYFARHDAAYTLAAPAARAKGVAVAPRREDLESMINAAFWASLRKEEDRPTRLSMAYLAPTQSRSPFVFERPLPLEPAALAKVAPAVERPHIHLGVWPEDGGDARVWGFSRTVPMLGFVLEVAGPGVLVVKHRRGGRYSKFVNVAVLAGEEAKIILESSGDCVDCHDVLHPLFARDVELQGAGLLDPASLFVRLAISMREHRRGGTLLVVPDGSDEWRESIADPAPYAVTNRYAELRRLAREHKAGRKRRDSLGRAISAVAGLTAVDGATLMTDAFDLHAFGAKIVRRRGRPSVERVLVSEPIEGNVPSEEAPAVLGGTRHLSAAQFVQDQPDSVALVASQEGRFTIFTWSESHAMVEAQRVDALLL